MVERALKQLKQQWHENHRTETQKRGNRKHHKSKSSQRKKK